MSNTEAELNADYVANHEHVYRCQDCGEIGRGPNPDAYAEGYENGKKAAETGQYAKGYQDAFNEIGGRIEALFVRWANEPIPAHIDGSSDAST